MIRQAITASMISRKFAVGAIIGASGLAAIAGCGGGGSSGSDTGAVDSARPSRVSFVVASCDPAFVVRLTTATCAASVSGSGSFDTSVTWSADGGSIDPSGLFTAPDAAQTVTITATSVQDSTKTTQTQVTVVDARPQTDRADDVTGFQVHVLYVIPSDGTDRLVDLNGKIANSVERWNTWLGQETGLRRIRMDTAGGDLDVSFVRLARTHATMNAFGGALREQLEFELVAKGFDDPEKLYLVYYAGGDGQTPACGMGGWPPLIPGTVAAMFMTAVPNGFDCSIVFFAATLDDPGQRDHIGIHEVLHSLGFVPTCAPHQANGAHLSDDVFDQLYVGVGKAFPPQLDVGRDDYFEHDIPGCPDLADSAFLDPLPANPQPPPGWPYPLLAPLSCSDEATMKAGSGDPTQIQFINATSSTVNVYRLDADGARELIRQVAVNEGYAESTFVTQPFVVTTETNACLGIYLPAASFGRAIIR